MCKHSYFLYQTIVVKKVKFLDDTVYLLLLFQREYIMLQVFILIVTNHRKNDYYVIYHPNVCKIVYS